MSISSTINLPSRQEQNFNTVQFAGTLAKYASRLRGFTCYPDGARGGQPLTVVPYVEAVGKLGEEFEEGVTNTDVCELTGTGHCGM
jgi:ribonucleoside-diphosphate reductase alpha chain